MPKMLHFGEFLKAWSLRSNSVTRQVNFNWTKISGKYNNLKNQIRHFEYFSNSVHKLGAWWITVIFANFLNQYLRRFFLVIYWPYHVSTHVVRCPQKKVHVNPIWLVSWALGTQSSSVAFVFLGFFFAVILKIVFLCTDFGQFLNYKDTFLNVYILYCTIRKKICVVIVFWLYHSNCWIRLNF